MSTTASAVTDGRTVYDLVSEEVRVLLARRRLPARALAPVIGRSQQAVSDRMSGVARWSLEDLDALAAFFGVDANALLPGLGSRASAAGCAPWDLNPEPADQGSALLSARVVSLLPTQRHVVDDLTTAGTAAALGPADAGATDRLVTIPAQLVARRGRAHRAA